tara:strand:+ start:16 stop:393 length:378 start_codon:yes stop_codon:yes gene_type:complete
MRSEKEILEKRFELQKEYTNRYFSVGNEPETNCVGEMVKLLEWVLKMPYITIQETNGKMSKEVILERLFQCKTEEDFVEMDNEIMKIKESGDTETAQALWQQLFMIEEGVGRDKLNQNKDGYDKT